MHLDIFCEYPVDKGKFGFKPRFITPHYTTHLRLEILYDTFCMNMQGLGKKILDITPIIESFEAQEGEVQQIIGKTGQGKTYEATRRAAIYLYNGYTVYTTWRLNLPEFYDEREHLWPVLRNLFTFRKNFYRFNLKENWKYVDLNDFASEGVFDTEKFSLFLAGLTDCIFMLDEGQDIFDSHQRAGKVARQTITRTRHMKKTLIIISQRAQAVDVTARGNVTFFYKCIRKDFLFFPPYFQVFRTDEIDDSNNHPLWLRHDSQGRVIWQADLWHKGFAKKWIYEMYDSWYMRKQQAKSQEINLEAYELSFVDRFLALIFAILGKKLSTRCAQVCKWALAFMLNLIDGWSIENVWRRLTWSSHKKSSEETRKSRTLRIAPRLPERKKERLGSFLKNDL